MSLIDLSPIDFSELKRPCLSKYFFRGGRGRGRGRGGRGSRTSGPTNKETLEKLSQHHPLPAKILEWRRISSSLTKVGAQGLLEFYLSFYFFKGQLILRHMVQLNRCFDRSCFLYNKNVCITLIWPWTVYTLPPTPSQQQAESLCMNPTYRMFPKTLIYRLDLQRIIVIAVPFFQLVLIHQSYCVYSFVVFCNCLF